MFATTSHLDPGNLLAVRFSCAGCIQGETFRKEGLLGMCSNIGTGAINLQEATLKVIRRFCTRRCGLTLFNCHTKRRPKFDRDLYQHILTKTELLSCDAAGEELKAQKILSGQGSSLKAAVSQRNYVSTLNTFIQNNIF